MAENETAARWIDGKCTKHTPTQVCDWIKDSWTKSVCPGFQKLRNAIADTATDIPKEFFVTTGIGHGNKNPLFLFLRPKKLLYIALALESIDIDDEKNPLVQIFRSYVQEWECGMQSMRERFPDNQSVSQCYHLLERLFELSRSILGIRASSTDQGWYDRYKGLYLEACEAFSDIPTHVADSRQMIAAVKEALERTSEVRPKRKKRELSDEDKEHKADIAKVVRELKLRTSHKPGLPRTSVMKALRILKMNPTFGPLIRSACLADSSWKKYVATSVKKSREKR